MGRVQALVGPTGSGKTEQLLARYRGALAEGPPGSTLWIAPTWRSAMAVRGRLLAEELVGCFTPGVLTFGQLSDAVLQAAPVRVRPLRRLFARQILRSLLDEAHEQGRLEHFGSIAGTNGLVDLVAGFIRELKRLEIWPDQFRQACVKRGLTQKDRELHAVYDAYQQILNEHDLFDSEGRFWAAREQMRRGNVAPFERVRLVVVDGFTDFTRTEHEILEILARRAEQTLISLPLEQGNSREQLFAKSRRTLAMLQERYQQLAVEWTSAGTPREPFALRHLERELFGNPRKAKRAADARGIEILAAAQPLSELQLVAGRIKQLLTRGDPEYGIGPISPDDVVVVMRSLGEHAALIDEVFAELGIPVAVESREVLADSPAMSQLVGLLQLESKGWPFRQLLAVLENSYFQPDWPQWRIGQVRRDTLRLVREFQIPTGRETLLGRLEHWANHATADEQIAAGDQANSVARRCQRAQAALPIIKLLAAILDCLPDRGAPKDWAIALARLARETGLLCEATVGRDRDAFEKLFAALGDSERVAAWLGEPAPVLDRRRALELVLEVLRVEMLPKQVNEAGRIRVLTASSARTLEIPYLFLAGLSERAFPPPDRSDGLYGESDTKRLSELGLGLAPRAQRSQGEMLLFYEVVTRATRRLYLSYPGLDATARPLCPSPYVNEVERVFVADVIERSEALDLRPVSQQTGEPQCPAEFRVKAVHAALDDDITLLAGLTSWQPTAAAADNILAALLLTDQRAKGEGFGVYEGMLTSDAVRERLATRFGPHHCWSASQLEQYALCPHRFYLEHVLGIEPLAELSLESDNRSRGHLAHEVLAAVHRQVNERCGSASSPCGVDDEVFNKSFLELVQSWVDRAHHDHPAGPGFREVDRRVLLKWGEDYLRQHRQYDELWNELDIPPVPTHFEVSFGPARGDAPVDPLSTETPFELTADGETIKLSGRIDRIDVGQVAGQFVFSLLDYKTGSDRKLSLKKLEETLVLQLPLYAIVVQELLLKNRGAVPWQIGYWHVKEKGVGENMRRVLYQRSGDKLSPAEEWKSLKKQVLAKVAALVRGIRRAEFPMHSSDDECTSNCPYHTVCRVTQIRALEKTWQAPAPDAS